MAWRLETSRRTGNKYFFNVSTNQSVWHDESLPTGWGWEQSGPDAPKVYVHLSTGQRSSERPTAELSPHQAPLLADAEQPSDPSLHRATFQRLLAIILVGDDEEGCSGVLGPPPTPSAPCVALLLSSDEKHPVTALGLAAKLGRVRIVRMLLDRFHANPNLRAERSGYTALGLAAFEGHARLCELLLEHGADPTLTNRWGETALRVAQKQRHVEVAELLQKHLAAQGGGGAPFGAAASAQLLAPASAITDKGMQLTLRGVLPSDQAAVARLYTLSQGIYSSDGTVEEAVHRAWTERVLAQDFADIFTHYGSIPRAAFWIATASRAEFVARSHGVEPDPELVVQVEAPQSAPGVGSSIVAAGGPSSTHAGALQAPELSLTTHSGSTQPASAVASSVVSPAQLGSLLSEGHVVVGCVAIVPAVEAPIVLPGASAAPPLTDTTCELQRMAAHPALHRSGIASTLIALVERSAPLLGYTQVQLSTLADMKPACALYRSRGYKQLGPVEGIAHVFQGHTIFKTAFCKVLATSFNAVPIAAAVSCAAETHTTAASAPAATIDDDFSSLQPVLPHGSTYVPQTEVAAAIAAGPAAVQALTLRIASLIETGAVPFPYKRRYTTQEQVSAWFSELQILPTARSLVLGQVYELHGVLDKGRSVAVRAVSLQLSGGLPGTIIERRALLVANGPVRLSAAESAAELRAASGRSDSAMPLSFTSFLGVCHCVCCGLMRLGPCLYVPLSPLSCILCRHRPCLQAL
jgi:ribosomal protein S18 acetylase RimI-like enzyme